ncbi:MAG: hypothetical protein ABL977_14915 [Candidatus Eisenbacteria bacterium]
MPVIKYPSVADQPPQRWHAPGDPANLERVEQLMALAAWLCPRARPRGVFRFRTIEEAQAWREAWPMPSRAARGGD